MTASKEDVVISCLVFAVSLYEVSISGEPDLKSCVASVTDAM